MEIHSKKAKIFIICGLVVVVSIVGATLLNLRKGNVELLEASPSASAQAEENPQTIWVHVKGAVNNGSLYELPKGARVNDAIEAAGGAAENADFTDVNLAMQLMDGDVVCIPEQGVRKQQPVVSGAARENTSGSSGELADGEKININIASAEELMKIPGVGEATAKKIIAYREATPFERIEDIMQIDNIGEKKYASMKDYITVE